MKEIKRVLMFGDREWTDRKKITKVIKKLIDIHGKTGFLVIEGGARGADTISGQVARNHGVHVAEVEALWDEYDKAAGPIRNGMMRALQPHIAIGFHSDLEHSSGTKDMFEKIRKTKAKVIHVK